MISISFVSKATYGIRTRNLQITNQVHYRCAKVAWFHANETNSEQSLSKLTPLLASMSMMRRLISKVMQPIR